MPVAGCAKEKRPLPHQVPRMTQRSMGGPLLTSVLSAVVISLAPAPQTASAQLPPDSGESGPAQVLYGHALETRFEAGEDSLTGDTDPGPWHFYYIRTTGDEGILIVSTEPPPPAGEPLRVYGSFQEDRWGGRLFVEVGRESAELEPLERDALGGAAETTPADASPFGHSPWLWVLGGLGLGAAPFLLLGLTRRIRNGPHAEPEDPHPSHLSAPPTRRLPTTSTGATRRLDSGEALR